MATSADILASLTDQTAAPAPADQTSPVIPPEHFLASLDQPTTDQGAAATPTVDDQLAAALAATGLDFGPTFDAMQFSITDVQPPIGSYVTPADVLSVDVWSSAPNATLTIAGRTFNLRGHQQPFAFSMPLGSGRVRQTQIIPLWYGYLQDIATSVSTSDGSVVPRGRIFARVRLVRGYGTSQVLPMDFVQGYVTSTRATGYPYTVPEDPLSGTGYTYLAASQVASVAPPVTFTVPANAVWQFRACNGKITTDATAGNRSVWVDVVDSGGNPEYIIASKYTHPPSIAVGYYVVGGGVFNDSATISVSPIGPIAQVGFPATLMFAGSQFQFQVGGASAGDRISNVSLWVTEWLVAT